MKPTIRMCYTASLAIVIHETFFKLVRYQGRETCIGVGRLILGAGQLILVVNTCETHG